MYLDAKTKLKYELRTIFPIIPIGNNNSEFSLERIFSLIDDYIHIYLNKIKENLKIINENSLENIVREVFNQNINANNIKWHVLAVEYSVNIIYKELRNISNQVENYNIISLKNPYIKGRLALLNDVIQDFDEFESKYECLLLGEKSNISFCRRSFSSREPFFNSREILRRNFYYNDITFSSVSVFLIRQSIELKLLRCLGIQKIKKEKDKKINAKYTQKQLLSFFKGNQYIYIPVDTDILLKIIRWTNIYIHEGYMNYHWLIILSQEYLKKLFISPIDSKSINLDGSIKIDENYFKTDLLDELLLKLKLDKRKVFIEKSSSPEAIIVPKNKW